MMQWSLFAEMTHQHATVLNQASSKTMKIYRTALDGVHADTKALMPKHVCDIT